MDRQEILNTLREKPEISVLIVGGGVNGIGTFRDLAHQGVDVLLVEKGDFCSGSSAASSHMLHGGIRYLENGEFRLVREALTERNLMLHNAPHYSKPLPTTIPIFSWFSGMFNAPLKFLRLREKPSERGALVIKLGLILYDIFARSYRVMPTHQFFMHDEALRRYPKVNPTVKCIARYYDAWMPYPERICMELVMDGEAANPNARALNYIRAVGAHGNSVTLRDEITGEEFTVRPKLVVNAAGPWIDFANRALGRETKFIGGTKGSHLIVDNPELYEAVGGGEFFFENKDGRIVLIFPFLDGKVMIGTTDIRVDDPEQARCTDDEIDYMLDLVGRVFPTIKVERSQIIFQFSGVRPLPSSDKSYTGNVSRDHSIQVVESDQNIAFPVLSLVGGKWTSWRAFSEQTTDRVLERLGITRRISTDQMAIGGGKDFPRDEAAQNAWIASLAQRYAIDLGRARTLFERYGTYAEQAAAFISAGTDAPLVYKPGYSRRELMFLAQHEKIMRLDDVILRRTLMAWLGGFTAPLLAELAEILAETLGWSETRKTDEIERAAKILSDKHGLALEKPISTLTDQDRR